MNKIDLSLLISSIFMLKQSVLKDYLFKVMKENSAWDYLYDAFWNLYSIQK